eukprot:2211222-Prymnesium_polylepis.1
MGYLQVTVESGQDLLAKDRGLLTKAATTSDPYVTLSVGDQWTKTLETREKTSVQAKTVNPTWNETLSTFVSDA